MSDDLPSAVVQEADCSERVVVLNIRIPGRTAYILIGAARTGGDAGLLPKGARQELWGGRLPPGSPRQKGREVALELARVVAVVGAEVFFEPHARPREDADEAADAEAGASAGAMIRCLRVHGGRVVVTDAPRPREARPFVDVLASEDARAELELRGIALARQLADDSIELHRVDLLRVLDKARQRIERRRAAIKEDLAKIAQADVIAAQAQWLVGEAARVPRGATKLVVTDWSTGEAVPMEVPLDPSRSAREQVEAMFKRAKRLKLGGRITEERLAQATAQAEAIATALDAVRAATSLVEMDSAARDAKTQAPRDVALLAGAGAGAKASPGGKAGPTKRVAFRTFLARSGRKILVGKGAADNDTLTLKVARPHDLWLHAKERTGAHVIVPLEKGQTCPAEDLIEAAHLAAHFSDARDEKVVDVQYTPKRHLRKPKGSAVGLVVVDREKVLALRFDAALLRTLLEREDL
jgi:predicted ribosome quality control (RQC) complex YloA/Tae2 family protein